jgi:hypothetical protein
VLLPSDVVVSKVDGHFINSKHVVDEVLFNGTISAKVTRECVEQIALTFNRLSTQTPPEHALSSEQTSSTTEGDLMPAGMPPEYEPYLRQAQRAFRYKTLTPVQQEVIPLVHACVQRCVRCLSSLVHVFVQSMQFAQCDLATVFSSLGVTTFCSAARRVLAKRLHIWYRCLQR